MSDDTVPPEDSPDASKSEAPPTPHSLHFFDDGLEVPSDSPPKPSLSLHAAATRALDEDEESTLGAPIAFPLPIELGLFHGVPAVQDTDSEEGDHADDDFADDDFADDTDNVICLLPRSTSPGSIWELKPAGEESVRESYDVSDTLPPPDESQIQGTVEALLLAADGPLTLTQLNTHLGEPGTAAVRSALYNVQSRFRRPGGGIRLVEVAKGWQLRTDMHAARYVSSLRGQQPFKLSKAALETLSIVAYRQPVTRSEVEDLRGVDPGGILRMLAERGLIAVTGRKDEPGRPLLYGTTPEFLSLFGLRDLSELPTLRDLRELQRDDARDGIGGTDNDIHATLNAAINVEIADAPTPLLHPVQEPLPLRPHDPID